jgi:hypothetical protein
MRHAPTTKWIQVILATVLLADLPVLSATTGEQLFLVPKGSRIQQSTPTRLARSWDGSTREYVIVLRSGGNGPRGPALLRPHTDWMDDYTVSLVDSE